MREFKTVFAGGTSYHKRFSLTATALARFRIYAFRLFPRRVVIVLETR